MEVGEKEELIQTETGDRSRLSHSIIQTSHFGVKIPLSLA